MFVIKIPSTRLNTLLIWNFWKIALFEWIRQCFDLFWMNIFSLDFIFSLFNIENCMEFELHEVKTYNWINAVEHVQCSIGSEPTSEAETYSHVTQHNAIRFYGISQTLCFVFEWNNSPFASLALLVCLTQLFFISIYLVMAIGWMEWRGTQRKKCGMSKMSWMSEMGRTKRDFGDMRREWKR